MSAGNIFSIIQFQTNGNAGNGNPIIDRLRGFGPILD
jgi:hypothetical protein